MTKLKDVGKRRAARARLLTNNHIQEFNECGALRWRESAGVWNAMGVSVAIHMDCGTIV